MVCACTKYGYMSMCTHVEVLADLGSLCQELTTLFTKVSLLNPELTGTVVLASQDALFLSARITGELPWSPGVCVDAEDVNFGPHAYTASALHTIPSPWSDSGTLLVKY